MELNVNFEQLSMIDISSFAKTNPKRVHVHNFYDYNVIQYTISNCICTGLQSQVIFPIFKDGDISCMLKESFVYDHDTAEILSTLRASRYFKLDMLEMAVPLYPYWADTFWHWILESLPKVLLLEQNGYEGVYIVDGQSKFILETLDLFNISKERIRFNNKKYYVHHLLLLHSPPARQMGKELFFLLRNSLLDKIGPLNGKKNCYIRRIGRRKVENEDEIVALLENYDFEIMTPEELPVIDQFRYISNADIVIQACGGSAALFTTLPIRSSYIELFSTDLIIYTNIMLVKFLELQYTPLCAVTGQTAKTPDCSSLKYAEYFKDFSIEIEPLKCIVENMLKQRNATRFFLHGGK